MTVQEAKEQLKQLTDEWENDENMYSKTMKLEMIEQKQINAIYMAIQALEEVEQYRALGTVEELKEAREKQVAKKPILYGDSEDGKLLCPNCNEDLWDVKECGYNGCPYCLQAIDWEEGGTSE